MKTVYQLVEEYKKRQTPQYKEMDIMRNDGSIVTYSNISNLREEHDKGPWLVFNSIFANEQEEIRIRGSANVICRTVQKIDE